MAEAKNDGGPAFPQPFMAMAANQSELTVPFPGDKPPGMSLRDWFAGMTLQGLIAGEPSIEQNGSPLIVDSKYVRVAYELADAMLAERDK